MKDYIKIKSKQNPMIIVNDEPIFTAINSISYCIQEIKSSNSDRTKKIGCLVFGLLPTENNIALMIKWKSMIIKNASLAIFEDQEDAIEKPILQMKDMVLMDNYKLNLNDKTYIRLELVGELISND